MFAQTPILRTTYGYAPIVMPETSMRLATASDIPFLRRWDDAPHVVAVSGDDGPWDWATEIDVPWQEVWLAEVAGSPIGVVVVLDAHSEPSHYWGEVSPGTFAIDIWIGELDYLRQRHGTAMMRHAIDRAFRVHGADTILIDPLESNTPAIAFYRDMGFQDVGPRRFGTDQCLVLQLHNPHHPHTFPPDSGGNAHTPPDSGGSNADPPESGGNG